MIGFDAVKHLTLCRIEHRPPQLDLAQYPHLPAARVATTAARTPWRCWGRAPSDGDIDTAARRASQGPAPADLLARGRQSGAAMRPRRAGLSALPVPTLRASAARREQRATERRIKAATCPVVKSLETFEFRAIPSLNKSLVLELARSAYLDRRENVLALGNSGTGKTHLALALGLAACQKGYRVRFTPPPRW